jgi:hypothetical protein
MSSSTPEEMKQKYIEKMGKDLGKYYYALRQELMWLYDKWSEYETLFGKSQSRVDLLNEAAPRFFRIVEDLLWEGVILHIACLTDKPIMNGFENLSIKKLPGLIVDNELKEKIETLIDYAVGQTKFCRDWRNKWIAHRDLKLIFQKEVLSPATRKKVDDALKSIADVLNTVVKYYQSPTTGFGVWEGAPDTALCLLYVIRKGLKVERERVERIERGEPREEDLFPEDDI